MIPTFVLRSVFYYKMWFTLAVLILNGFCVYGSVDLEDYYRLDIIHYNDFHARFEETSLSSAICQTNNGSCLGGFPRLYHEIQVLMKQKPDAILLNAGDSFQGTYWYTLLKWNVTQEFMNMLPHDAHAIGNHEFDDGPEGLAPYLKALKAPVLAANMDVSMEPSLQGTFKPSIVIEKKGRKIGIIGLVTVDSKPLSNTKNVIFTDPGEATERESLALKEQGVDIIILLSHCGLDVDKEIARTYGQYIDVIIGGHTHSLLWNGPSPSGDPVVGPYPVFIESDSDSNRKVLIVQASSYTKFIGNLSVFFDNRNKYVTWNGGPIFLNRSVEEDEEIKRKLKPYAKLVHEAENVQVAESLINLDSNDCSHKECGFGNLVTDAMVEWLKSKVDPSKKCIAFIQRMNLRSKIEKGSITNGRLLDIVPFHDRIEHFQLTGTDLKAVLERNVCDESMNNAASPWFLHFSGLQVTYNVSRSEGDRVVSAFILTEVSKTRLQNDQLYDIIAPSFWSFAPGYAMFKPLKRNTQVIGYDIDILESYLKAHTPINVPTTGRIFFRRTLIII